MPLALMGFLVAAGFGCATPEPHGTFIGNSSVPAQGADLSDLNPHDSVSPDEARRLAELYFRCRYGNCGMLGEISDQRTQWRFPCYVGIAGTERPPIAVSKTELRLQCKNGPTITNLSQFTQLSLADWGWNGTANRKDKK